MIAGSCSGIDARSALIEGGNLVPVASRTIVAPTPGRARLSPLDAAGVRVTGGFWGERLATNRARTIPHGLAQLETSGALGNFRHAARGSGRYVGGLDDAGITFPFLDSDVYKWLEAVGWELGRERDAGLEQEAGAVIDLVASAQRPNGYLGTFVQLSGRQEFSDLQWGHELYCIGHLIQAAVAWSRSVGDDRLLNVGRRAVERIREELGPGARDGVDGHPEIEMALVELYRETGEEQYLELARHFVEQRGRGLLGRGRFGAGYWQDGEPVRVASTVTGHSVRQLYLDAGAVDVATETGDTELLEAVIRRWEDMVATRSYLTGGVGSRHRDEAFGARYELPPDRAYTETCAAIASVMLGWRLLLATGEPRFGDVIERTLLNAVLPGVGLDGRSFFYVNPLQWRGDAATDRAVETRQAWYPCACCPPNVMRTLSSFEHMLATTDGSGLQLHQYAAGTIEAQVAGGRLALQVSTDYPGDGRVAVELTSAPDAPVTLSFRAPSWCRSSTITDPDGAAQSAELADGSIQVTRTWKPGDRVELVMAMPPRITVPDYRVDAVRGCVAIERGPIVYCLEQRDLPAGTALEDVALAVGGELAPVPAPDGLTTLQGVRVTLGVQPSAAPGWPYRDGTSATTGTSERTSATAIPYCEWANRGAGPMRVWIPAGDGQT
jgi:DUF1680 family protein